MLLVAFRCGRESGPTPEPCMLSYILIFLERSWRPLPQPDSASLLLTICPVVPGAGQFQSEDIANLDSSPQRVGFLSREISAAVLQLQALGLLNPTS